MGNAKGKNHRAGTMSITTLSQLRKQLTRVWNKYKQSCDESDEPMTSEQARTFGYLAGVLRHCIYDGDLEERIAAIEEMLTERNKENAGSSYISYGSSESKTAN